MKNFFNQIWPYILDNLIAIVALILSVINTTTAHRDRKPFCKLTLAFEKGIWNLSRVQGHPVPVDTLYFHAYLTNTGKQNVYPETIAIYEKASGFTKYFCQRDKCKGVLLPGESRTFSLDATEFVLHKENPFKSEKLHFFAEVTLTVGNRFRSQTIPVEKTTLTDAATEKLRQTPTPLKELFQAGSRE